MRKRSLAVAGGLFLLLGLIATPALADCAETLKKLEDSFVRMPSSHPNHSKVQSLIHEATQALEQGKKNKCEKKAATAEKILSNMRR